MEVWDRYGESAFIGNILVVVSGWVEVAVELRDGHAFDERRALADLSREQSDTPPAQLLNVPFAVVVSPTGSPNSKAESSSLSSFYFAYPSTMGFGSWQAVTRHTDPGTPDYWESLRPTPKSNPQICVDLLGCFRYARSKFSKRRMCGEFAWESA